jgi:hypothetical protein
MNDVTVDTTKKSEESRPKYETPRVQQMSERDILNQFQVTQAMATWWTSGC